MFIDNLKEELNVSTTENGALGYATTNKHMLDFNFKIASYRSMSENKIKVDFKKVWNEDKELALKYLFYIRDIREGLGERRLFRICIKQIVNSLDSRVFNWIEEYGRLDDIFVFIGTSLENNLITFISNKLSEDMQNMQNKKPISLLAKWMPSINTSSKETKKLAKYLVSKLNITQYKYRKLLSGLRSYLKVVEKQLCKNEWDKINYEQVSSQANLKYNNAFLKHDEIRRRAYLEKVSEGKAKINSSTLFPHDIIHKYNLSSNFYSWDQDSTSFDLTLEELWKALPNYVDGESNTLVIRDGSGSMKNTLGNSNVTALDVSTGLAIYFAQRSKGQFKDKFITFSHKPQLISFENYDSLYDILKYVYTYDDYTNTDIESVFKLVLNTAIKNNLSQEEIPNLLIISDMEFDSTSMNLDKNLFKSISELYNSYGYKVPKLIFWNVNSRSNTIPLVQNDLGLILVSGFSPIISKLVLSEETDVYKVLLNTVLSNRYKQITLG